MYVHHYFIKGIFSFVYLYCCYLPLDLEHVRQQCSFMHTFFITMQLEMQCLSMKQPFTRCNATQSLFTCLVSLHIPSQSHMLVSHTQWKQSSQYRFAPLAVRKERWFAVCWKMRFCYCSCLCWLLLLMQIISLLTLPCYNLYDWLLVLMCVCVWHWIGFSCLHVS